MSVESEAKNVNEKFAFIKEIYSDSWALIIGINKYKYVQSLNYAADDAMDVKKILVEKYGFKEIKSEGDTPYKRSDIKMEMQLVYS